VRLLGYWPADFVFAFGVAMMFAVLWFLHLRGQINLVDCLTATDRHGIVRTDARKLIELATWYTLTLGFVYIVIQDKLTEWYVMAYIGGATVTRYLRDREQRLSSASTRQRPDNPDRIANAPF